jgi:hypothetical protein
VASEHLGNRTYTGPAIEVAFKYDHIFQGWDFAAEDSRLAMRTHLMFGTKVSERLFDFLQLQFHPRAADDGGHVEDGGVSSPTLITTDRLVFADEWTRVGHLKWISDVTVDGTEETMAFHVLGSRKVDRVGGFFPGLMVVGAFVYPQGSTIVHDPELAMSASFPTTEALRLFPLGLVVAQAVVAVAAVAGAMVYRYLGPRA